jgi:tetratricopeptide (TPR) repeat protein
MIRRRHFSTFIAAMFLLTVLPSAAQQAPSPTAAGVSSEFFNTPAVDPATGAPIGGFGTIDPRMMLQGRWLVEGVVQDMDGNPISRVRIAVEPMNGGADERVLQSDIQGRFSTQYFLNPELNRDLRISLIATKKGYPKAHETVHFTNSEKPWAVIITLREPHPDADLLSQEELISTLVPRLKSLSAADGLPAKSEKDYARGVAELVERDRPDHAVASFDKVAERNPNCVECRTMLSLADLASEDWDSALRDLESAVTTSIKDHQAGRPEPLLLYGVLQSWRHNYSQASAYCAAALKYSPKDPMALQEAGRAELMLQHWPVADAYLRQALEAGAGPGARLLRVKALLGEGSTNEALSEMKRYLAGRDVKNMPLPVRELYLQAQQKKKVEVMYAKVKPKVDEPLDYLRRTTPELSGLKPVADQRPLAGILSAVGKNVADAFETYPNTSSVEDIHEEKLSRKGKREGYLDEEFHYLCVVPDENWGPGFSEYRDPVGKEQGQAHGLSEGFMVTSGFTSASLIFHPAYQDESTFRYLGRQEMDGVDAYVVAFAQIPAKSKLYGTFKSTDGFVTTFTQGLAWVNPQTYEIVRLRTDLLRPLPEVKLQRQTTDITYAPVQFKNIAGAFWLPKDVTVTVSWANRRLRNEHEYSGFRAFNVAESQKIASPKGAASEASEKLAQPKSQP